MTTATLEHINLTVSNPEKTAALLSNIFGWQVRWQGDAKDQGRTVHVGTPGEGSTYIALYTHSGLEHNNQRGHKTATNLNHIGIVVEDLDNIEQRVIAQGLAPFSHEDYEPGRRFYFHIDDGIEVEAISYS